MRGYVARKGDRWYAVVYEGLDPITGKEKRSWNPAGTSREEAKQLAARLAAELNGRNHKVRSLTFGAYLAGQWLPGKKINLGSFHLGRLPPEDRPAHPPRNRPSPDTTAPCPPPGDALRPDAVIQPTVGAHWRRHRIPAHKLPPRR